MQDLLTKYHPYLISTPSSTNREITFSVDFNDSEFQSWETTYHKSTPALVLYTTEGSILRFKYYGGLLSANDPRGGVSIIKPPSNSISKWALWALDPSTEPLRGEALIVLDIKKSSPTAIVGPYIVDGMDTYDPPNMDTMTVLDSLFSAGYANVLVLNFRMQDTSAVFLLSNLTKYLNKTTTIGEIGAVQVVSRASGEPAELIPVTSEWYNFAVSATIWAKIRNIVLESKVNFDSAMNHAFDRERLVRLATKMSRDSNSTPDDANMSGFYSKGISINHLTERVSSGYSPQQ